MLFIFIIGKLLNQFNIRFNKKIRDVGITIRYDIV